MHVKIGNSRKRTNKTSEIQRYCIFSFDERNIDLELKYEI